MSGQSPYTTRGRGRGGGGRGGGQQGSQTFETAEQLLQRALNMAGGSPAVRPPSQQPNVETLLAAMQAQQSQPPPRMTERQMTRNQTNPRPQPSYAAYQARPQAQTPRPGGQNASGGGGGSSTSNMTYQQQVQMAQVALDRGQITQEMYQGLLSKIPPGVASAFSGRPMGTPRPPVRPQTPMGPTPGQYGIRPTGTPDGVRPVIRPVTPSFAPLPGSPMPGRPSMLGPRPPMMYRPPGAAQIVDPPNDGRPKPLVTREKIEQMVKQMDPTEKLDPEVIEILYELADDFVQNTTVLGAKLAKHRGGTTLEVKDIAIPMERLYGMRISGVDAKVPGMEMDGNDAVRRSTRNAGK